MVYGAWRHKALGVQASSESIGRIASQGEWKQKKAKNRPFTLKVSATSDRRDFNVARSITARKKGHFFEGRIEWSVKVTANIETFSEHKGNNGNWRRSKMCIKGTWYRAPLFSWWARGSEWWRGRSSRLHLQIFYVIHIFVLYITIILWLEGRFLCKERVSIDNRTCVEFCKKSDV